MSKYTVFSRPAKPLENLIRVAQGRLPADLVIKGSSFFNAFTGKFEKGDVAVQDGFVAGTGTYEGREVFDATGRFLIPGYIDAHVHLESTMASPVEFARVVSAHGTSAVIADPHEIANVAGAAGLEYILAATEELPITVYVMLPSCVPASPLEWGGARLDAEDMQPFLGHPRVLGLGEMMNYPGVLNCAPDVLAKLRLAVDQAENYGERLRIDGHSPGLQGIALQAYIAAGITSDHECTTPKEAAERISSGMAVMLRQGTAAKNLIDLLPVVNAHTAPLCMLATDDIHLSELVNQGHINYLVKLAAEDGRVPLPDILKMASFNAARHYDLRDSGAIAPGYRADFALYPDLETWLPTHVWHKGRVVAENGESVWASPNAVGMPGTMDAPDTMDAPNAPDAINTRDLPGQERIRHSVHLPALSEESLQIRAAGPHVRVIGIVPGQIITEHLIMQLAPKDGAYHADPAADLAKAAVVERHRNSGNIGLGFVQGMGLARGAIASTVAHDSHNLVVVGMNDGDMLAAMHAVQEMDGGLAAVLDGKLLAGVPLPLAGLLSQGTARDIEDGMAKLHEAVRALRGRGNEDLFMLLSFLSLPVIPKLKLTEAGLVDVERFAVVETVF